MPLFIKLCCLFVVITCLNRAKQELACANGVLGSAQLGSRILRGCQSSRTLVLSDKSVLLTVPKGDQQAFH